MITDCKNWHYLDVKRLSALFRGIIWNHDGAENKFKKYEKVCNDHDYCYIEMPDEFDEILKYNYGGKSLKAPAIIYADLECLIDKMNSCQNNPEKSYTNEKN